MVDKQSGWWKVEDGRMATAQDCAEKNVILRFLAKQEVKSNKERHPEEQHFPCALSGALDYVNFCAKPDDTIDER